MVIWVGVGQGWREVLVTHCSEPSEGGNGPRVGIERSLARYCSCLNVGLDPDA